MGVLSGRERGAMDAHRLGCRSRSVASKTARTSAWPLTICSGLRKAFPELSDDPPLVAFWLVPVVYSQDSYSKRISVWQSKGSILVNVNHQGRMRVALRITWVRHPVLREAENLARSCQPF